MLRRGGVAKEEHAKVAANALVGFHYTHTTLFTSGGSKVRINKFIQIDY